MEDHLNREPSKFKNETAGSNDGPRDPLPDDVKKVLDRAGATVEQIEVEVDELNDLMFELFRLGFDPSGEGLVEELADDLGVAANDLFNTLNRRFEMLRREVTTAGGDRRRD
jgi:hypothetical protein